MKKALKLTRLDFAILGLLQQEPSSGYKIRKMFETTALGNFSSSPGSIYPSIQKLKKLKLIDPLNSTKSKSPSSVLSISANGKEAFVNWLKSPVKPEDISRRQEDLILRFAFMGDWVTREEKIVFLTSLASLLAAYITELEKYYELESSQLTINGGIALAHGIEMCKTRLVWAKQSIEFFTTSKK